jgi:hypothetical protein
MLAHVVLGLSRLLPRASEREASRPEWSESEPGWHHSSHALSTGLDVIEHFDAAPVFPDTHPSCHWPAQAA